MLSLATILLPATALTRYDDHGEPLLRTSERLLVAMHRIDTAAFGTQRPRGRGGRKRSI